LLGIGLGLDIGLAAGGWKYYKELCTQTKWQWAVADWV